MIFSVCRLVAVVAIIGALAGCATVQETTEQKPDAELEPGDCVSEEGQNLLTYCVSSEAAQQAERQYLIAAGADEEPAEDMVPLPVEGAPVRGERDAAVTLHLFSDLTCGDCRAVYERLAAEVDTRPGQLRLVFRHLPRDTAGESAARAAIAADEQGKFWEFVDQLYAGDALPPEQRWADIARNAGLDIDAWERDRRSPIANAVLERDTIKAEEVDVVDAPTFFVNGIRGVGGVALPEFDEKLSREMQHVDRMEDAGLSGADISWRRILHNYQPVDWEEVDRAEEELHRELRIVHVPVDDAPQLGATEEESLVTIAVFADFQCEYSAQLMAVLDELVDSFGDEGLRVVFRHFPLETHGPSRRAAAASVIAGEQGQFWTFLRRLYAEEIGVDDAALERGLRDLGWDGDFEAEVTDEAVVEVVDDDLSVGTRVGVEGTPTMYVNGIELMGVWSAGELAPLIADQIELARSVAELTENSGEQLYRDVVEANRGE